MFKRICFLILTAVILLSGCSTGAGQNSADNGRLKVVTSFYPMYDFAKKVGGDKVDITNLIPAGTEPHDWEPSTSDIIKLDKTDVFIYNGAGMEGWAADVMSSLQNKNLTIVEASKGIQLINTSVSGQTASYDPHVWLNPENAKAEMKNILNAFCSVHPSDAAYFQSNYDKYSAGFDALDSDYKNALEPYKGKSIVVSHAAFGYLCAAYGFNQVAIEGMDADSEPNPSTMAKIIQFIKDNNVKVIFSEELISPKVAQTIASQTGAETEALNPLEGLSDSEIASGEDYISVMKNNLEELKKAFE